jgi:hypothetical protein
MKYFLISSKFFFKNNEIFNLLFTHLRHKYLAIINKDTFCYCKHVSAC